jgi:hypothetical protein
LPANGPVRQHNIGLRYPNRASAKYASRPRSLALPGVVLHLRRRQNGWGVSHKGETGAGLRHLRLSRRRRAPVLPLHLRGEHFPQIARLCRASAFSTRTSTSPSNTASPTGCFKPTRAPARRRICSSFLELRPRTTSTTQTPTAVRRRRIDTKHLSTRPWRPPWRRLQRYWTRGRSSDVGSWRTARLGWKLSDRSAYRKAPAFAKSAKGWATLGQSKNQRRRTRVSALHFGDY